MEGGKPFIDTTFMDKVKKIQGGGKVTVEAIEAGEIGDELEARGVPPEDIKCHCWFKRGEGVTTFMVEIWIIKKY